MASWAPLNTQPSFAADTMLLLTDGTVMVHELNTSHWHRLTPDSSGSYVNGSWSTLASLPDNNGIPTSKGGPTNAPLYFASAVLGDGTVFVAGGENNTGKADADILTAQIYDPLSDVWTAIATPPGWTGVGDAPTCVLPDGRLLIGSFDSSANALFDPKTQIWQAGGTKADSCSEETFTLMPNGNVLTVECSNVPNAEQYIPSSNRWVSANSTPATLPQACPGFVAEIGPAILLPDGRVFAIGATGATALYTPDPDATKAGTWASGPSLVDSHNNPSFPMDTPAALLPNGKVLFASAPGPPCDYPSPTTFFLYDPSTNTASVEISSSNGDGSPFGGRMLLLPTGQVLYSASRKDIEIYTPDAGGDPSWKPVLTNFPDTLIVGKAHTISGTQFNGLSQACSYGDDAQMATNYPIVQLKSGSKIYFLRSSNHSTMGVATGNATVSTNIFVPTNVPAGPAIMTVIANGIASDPVSVTVTTRDSFFLVDRSTFSQGEILALINLNGAPATISDAVFVVVEGFSKDQIGGNAPSIPNPLPQISLQPAGPAIPQDPMLPSSAVQRFSFPFNIVFQDASVFGTTSQTLTLTSQFSADNSNVTASAQIVLLDTPNPYILHGDVSAGGPWYLSIDLRVFQIGAGQTKFGTKIATTGNAKTVATNYISTVISNLNSDPALGPAFDAIPQDENASALMLAPADANNNPVYNFGIARVRYRDVQDVHRVRVFFRLWPAQQTNATYDTTTYYRSHQSGTTKVPLLGIQGDEIVTIPFFASPRVSITAPLTQQLDTPNVQSIKADQFGGETDAYFGCWLDINQPNDLRFPPRMVGGNPADIPDGPFNTFNPLVSIQQLVRSQHQCLLAEIAFDPDPIPANADPSTSDKLAQRNLTFVPVPNPGVDPSRIVPQTLEIRPSPQILKKDGRPDELMILWGATPAGSRASFYFPGTTAAEILNWAGKLYTVHNIKRVDAHTVQVPTGGITFLPVPQGTAVNFAGLLSLSFPPTVHKGDKYDVTVRQITSEEFDPIIIEARTGGTPQKRPDGSFTWRRTMGTFQLTIPVGTKASLRETEERLFAILQYIQQSIPAESRWFQVFIRYLQQIAGRVKGLGGDPTQIPPSGTGQIPGKGIRPHREEFAGKIAGLIYDHFGDFLGFLLETADCDVRRFESREVRMERVVREAWEIRATVYVIVELHRPHCPLEVIVGGAPL